MAIESSDVQSEKTVIKCRLPPWRRIREALVNAPKLKATCTMCGSPVRKDHLERHSLVKCPKRSQVATPKLPISPPRQAPAVTKSAAVSSPIATPPTDLLT